MKQIPILITSTLIIILGAACTMFPFEANNTLDDTYKKEVTYYWYNGKMIPLTISNKYYNVVGDYSNSKTISDLLSRNLIDYTKANHNIDGVMTIRIQSHNRTKSSPTVSYSEIASSLKEEQAEVKVLPFIEVGDSDNVIGTSDVFYVKTRVNDTLSLNRVADSLSLKILSDIPYTPDWYILSIVDSVFDNVFEASNSLFETGLFEAIDPAFMFNFKPSYSVNDPYYPSQWGLNNHSNPQYDINAESAWNISRGEGVSIAIIDTGVDPQNIDIAPNFSSISYDAATGGHKSIFLGENHGTHVAGIMTAVGNNNYQIIGVAPESKLMRVSQTFNFSPTISSHLASGMNWAWSSGADIINCSWGDQDRKFQDSLKSTILEESIKNAIEKGRDGKGTVVVFASGNYQIVEYPGNSDERIITVGAIDSSGIKTDISGFGDKLDCVAPGENILSTLSYNHIGRASGTSMAAPHVSGTIALMLAANPNLTREEVETIIGLTAKRVHPEIYDYGFKYGRFDGSWCQEMGYGLVDAGYAVALANVAKQDYIQSGGYSIVMDALPGATHLEGDGSISYISASGNSFTFGIAQNINNNYIYFWQVLEPTAKNAKPTITITDHGGGVITFPPYISAGARIKLRCIIMNKSVLIGAPTITVNII